MCLVSAFFFQPLFTGALQVQSDSAYTSLPFKEAVSRQVVARNPARADTLLEQLPFHSLVRQRLLAGQAPLWSHELGTGEPLLGNAQSAPFAPLHLMALPLVPLHGLTVAAAWAALVGLLLMHALLLHLGAGPWGAGVGAVAAGLSVYAMAWSYDVLGMAAAWVPGVLLGILLVRDGEPRSRAGLIVCALGVTLSGHPETTAHVALLAAVVAAAQLVGRPLSGGGRLAFLGRLASAAALTAALAAPAVLPELEELPESARWHGVQRGHFDLDPSFAPRTLLPVVSPLVFGSPRDGNYHQELGFNELCSPYAGLLALALALAGAFSRRRGVIAIVAGGAVALAAALELPPLPQLMAWLPMLGSAQHGRLRHFWVLAIAAAAGLVAEPVIEDRRLRQLAAAAIALAGVALALAPPPGGAPWQRAWWCAVLAGAAAALAALLVPAWRGRFPQVVLAGLVLDLFLLGVRYHTAVPRDLDLAPPPALAFLARQSGAAPQPFRVLAEGSSLPPNLNALFGLWDPRGNDPMRPERSARWVGWRLGHQRRYHELITAKRSADQEDKDNLGIRFQLTEHDRDLPPPWRLAFEGAGGRVWENPQALSLFFVPRAVRRCATPAKALHAALRLGDFRAVGVVVGDGATKARERALAQDATAAREATAAQEEAAAQEGAVGEVHPISNGFDLTVESAAGATVFSSVSYTRGWLVGIHDREWPAVEVNGGFLGFAVPAGRNSVRLRYRPRGWTLGLILCAGGLLAAALAARGNRRADSAGVQQLDCTPRALAHDAATPRPSPILVRGRRRAWRLTFTPTPPKKSGGALTS